MFSCRLLRPGVRIYLHVAGGGDGSKGVSRQLREDARVLSMTTLISLLRGQSLTSRE